MTTYSDLPAEQQDEYDRIDNHLPDNPDASDLLGFMAEDGKTGEVSLTLDVWDVLLLMSALNRGHEIAGEEGDERAQLRYHSLRTRLHNSNPGFIGLIDTLVDNAEFGGEP